LLDYLPSLDTQLLVVASASNNKRRKYE